MTDKEVLQIAIEIAIENGYSPLVDTNIKPEGSGVICEDGQMIQFAFSYGAKAPSHWEAINTVIFSHDFAKAFWGEEPFNGFKTFFSDGYTYTMKPLYQMCNDPEAAKRADAVWKAHLQQMVLCENTIDYLRKFIKDDKT